MKVLRHPILKGLLLALFVAYYANISLFSHTHVINGVTIVHSHFYSEFGSEQPAEHTHSTVELQLIATISAFSATLPAAQPTFNAPEVLFLEQHAESTQQPVKAACLGLQQLRAPPITLS